MPRPSYYAVRAGRVPGIYRSWADCEAQIKSFQGALYKKLATEAEAIEFIAPAKPCIPRTRDLVPSAVSDPSVVRAARTVPDDEDDSDIVHCDGACKGNGQPGSIAGIGVWWAHGDPRNISERCPGDQTNNRAELIAIVRILETTPRLKRRLIIKTDSNYSIQCVTSWISKWIRNGFLTSDGKPVKNRALIKYLAALLHVRRQTSQSVQFKHVRGHVGIEGNEAADLFANLGATKPTAPEQDWERLEKKALQSLKSTGPVKVADEDLEAYADGLLDDEELAQLSDVSVGSMTVPARQRSLAPHQASPPWGNVAGPIKATAGTAVRHTSESPSRDVSRPTPGNVAQGIRSSPPATVDATSKVEMEIFASCLLDEAELATAGKDGVFESDF